MPVGALVITSGRIRLRPWREEDRAPFAAICADPEVMRYLGPLQTRAETDAAIDRANGGIVENGLGFRALERIADASLLGFCGLKRITIAGPMLGEVEIGWRLRRDAWGQGYAFEGARAARDHGLLLQRLPGLFAFTVAANTRSWGLMERLDMGRRPELDFNHPDLAADNPLRRHIVYSVEAL